MSQSADVISTLTEKPREESAKSWLVCLCSALFFFYEFIQMNMFNPINEQLRESFHLDALHMGYFSDTYLFGDVLMLIFAGLIIDRFSTRRVILLAMASCVLATYGFAFTHSLFLAGFCHFLTGAGSAFCFLSAMVLASRWFPPERQGLVIGAIVTMAMLGGSFAQTVLECWTEHFGWREAILQNAFIGTILLMVIWFFVEDSPKQKIFKPCVSLGQKVLNPRQSFLLAVRNRQNWRCGFYTSLLNLPIMILGALWGSSFLMQVHHLSAHQASFVSSMLFNGTIVGSPLVGWYSDKIGLRKRPMIEGAILSMITLLVLMYVPHLSYLSLTLLFFLLGLFTSSQIVSYPTVKESNPSAINGACLGLTSFIIMSGGLFGQPLYSWVMQLSWHGLMQNGIPVYSSQAFINGMWLIVMGFLIGLMAALGIKETFCRNKNN